MGITEQYNKVKRKQGVKKMAGAKKVKTKLRMVMAEAGVSSRQLSNVWGCEPGSAATKFGKGIYNIEDLIKIVEYCGGHVIIETKNKMIMPLTLNDLE